MAEKSESNNLCIKVNVDVSDALTGLKAVQREAKETVKALKEVESLNTQKSLSNYSTKELHEELSKREGVKEIVVHFTDDEEIHVPGPAKVLINHD